MTAPRKPESKLPGLRAALRLVRPWMLAYGFKERVYAANCIADDIRSLIRREEAREKGRGK